MPLEVGGGNAVVVQPLHEYELWGMHIPFFFPSEKHVFVVVVQHIGLSVFLLCLHPGKLLRSVR